MTSVELMPNPIIYHRPLSLGCDHGVLPLRLNVAFHQPSVRLNITWAEFNLLTREKKKMRWPTLGTALTVLAGGLMPLGAQAHGFAGKRFFPAPLIAIDDPFVVDELDLLLSHRPNANEDGGKVDSTEATLEFSKRITNRLSLSIGTEYAHLNPAEGPIQNGFNNMEVGIKFQGPISAERESVVAIGLDVELGGTGSHVVDRESFSVFSPTFFLGQGFGNLPESVKYLRPLAMISTIAYNIPTRGSEPRSLSSGFTLQYNLAYLEDFVKDVGLPGFMHNMVPLVEAPLQFCLDKGCNGELTGTVNPGVIWFNHWGQVSMEAAIPVNDRTGDGVGALLQLHVYLDNLYPHSLGKPLFD